MDTPSSTTTVSIISDIGTTFSNVLETYKKRCEGDQRCPNEDLEKTIEDAASDLLAELAHHVNALGLEFIVGDKMGQSTLKRQLYALQALATSLVAEERTSFPKLAIQDEITLMSKIRVFRADCILALCAQSQRMSLSAKTMDSPIILVEKSGSRPPSFENSHETFWEPSVFESEVSSIRTERPNILAIQNRKKKSTLVTMAHRVRGKLFIKITPASESSGSTWTLQSSLRQASFRESPLTSNHNLQDLLPCWTLEAGASWKIEKPQEEYENQEEVTVSPPKPFEPRSNPVTPPEQPLEREGSILTTSSTRTLVAPPELAHYHRTKGTIDGNHAQYTRFPGSSNSEAKATYIFTGYGPRSKWENGFLP